MAPSHYKRQKSTLIVNPIEKLAKVGKRSESPRNESHLACNKVAKRSDHKEMNYIHVAWDKVVKKSESQRNESHVACNKVVMHTHLKLDVVIAKS